ncbi:MAG: sulfoxide reductase heme-binding subunit YedZ [Gemmatimonadetes bacterium]|nr:sulfoxide reductase heme-binding subunit YedZ [Gemmatimonadota bacterium]HPF61567.1 protein-methionine-sulfoxide reductase heme-binding subunit MsrQ [Gemmatimonadales bacterium]
MTRAAWVTRVVRPAIVVGGIIPLGVITWRLFSGEGDYANPAEALEHATGFTALWFLLASLAATPLRRLSGLAALTQLRKPLGLWAFVYALVHLGCYLVFDQSLLWGEIGHDILERPYITVGFAAFVILLALAATSPVRIMKRLGGRRWQALHRLVYVAAALGVLHFLWLVKRDLTEPLIAAAVLVVLLAARVRGGPARVAAPRPATDATLPSSP